MQPDIRQLNQKISPDRGDPPVTISSLTGNRRHIMPPLLQPIVVRAQSSASIRPPDTGGKPILTQSSASARPPDDGTYPIMAQSFAPMVQPPNKFDDLVGAHNYAPRTNIHICFLAPNARALARCRARARNRQSSALLERRKE